MNKIWRKKNGWISKKYQQMDEKEEGDVESRDCMHRRYSLVIPIFNYAYVYIKYTFVF